MVNLYVIPGPIVLILKVALNANVKMVTKVMVTNAPKSIYVHLQEGAIMVNARFSKMCMGSYVIVTLVIKDGVTG